MAISNKRKRDEAMKFMEFIISDAEYRAMLLKRARAGVLNPSVEMMLWNYVLGKPGSLIDATDAHEVEDLTGMTLDQLQERHAQLVKEVAEMKKDEAVH